MRGRRQDLRRKARGFASLPPRHRRRAARQAGAVPRDAPRIICADRPAVSRMRGSARHPGAGGMGKRGHGRRIAGGEAAKGICMLPSVRLLQAGGLGPWQARCKAARAAIRRPAPCASARRAARAQDDAAPRRAGSGVRGRCRGPAAPAHRLAEPPVPASRHEQPRIFQAAASTKPLPRLQHVRQQYFDSGPSPPPQTGRQNLAMDGFPLPDKFGTVEPFEGSVIADASTINAMKNRSQIGTRPPAAAPSKGSERRAAPSCLARRGSSL